MAELTFLSLFEREEKGLRDSLEGCTLPKDAQKLQTIVSQYLAKMFDEDGELRMNLTQSEDYILQAAISLLNAQQQIANTMTKETISSFENSSCTCSTTSSESSTTSTSSESRNETKSDLKSDLKSDKNFINTQVPGTSALAGSAVGGIGGGLLLGTWGAVFGAIAGTALILYISTTDSKKKPSAPISKQLELKEKATVQEIPVNVDQYIEILRNICRSLDSLIDTFRAQIKRVAQNYESFKEHTLEDDFSELLENIQSLIGSFDNNKSLSLPSKLTSKIEDLVEILEGYGLTIVRYNETSKKYFNSVSSPNVDEIVVAAPAILKDDKIILKGKLFIPCEK